MKVFRTFLAVLTLVCSVISLAQFADAQARRQRKKSVSGGQGSGIAISAGAVTTSSETKTEPNLLTAPCAKESESQILELENAPDLNAQLVNLVTRARDKDVWTRSCAVYRLGRFGAAAQDTLPLMIQLLREERDTAVWGHVNAAFWRIPPDRSLKLEQRIKLAKDPDVQRRIYGLYTLAHFRTPAASFQEKDLMSALIEALNDEDPTARWMALMAIRQQGINGANIAVVIPVLEDLVSDKKINPQHVLDTFVPLGRRALAAAPLLADILFDTEKYVAREDGVREDVHRVRVYGLYVSAAMALGSIGPDLLPVLTDQAEKYPQAVIKVLSYMPKDRTLNLLLRFAGSTDARVREAAAEQFRGLNTTLALEALPTLLKLADDKDPRVFERAMTALGSFGEIKDATPELRAAIRSKVLPKLLAGLAREDNCYPMFALGKLREPKGLAAIGKINKATGNYCAETALFEAGPDGHKYLTAKALEEQKTRREAGGLHRLPLWDEPKIKEIKPKTPAEPASAIDKSDT